MNLVSYIVHKLGAGICLLLVEEQAGGVFTGYKVVGGKLTLRLPEAVTQTRLSSCRWRHTTSPVCGGRESGQREDGSECGERKYQCGEGGSLKREVGSVERKE